jgi:hypothetical protein
MRRLAAWGILALTLGCGGSPDPWSPDPGAISLEAASSDGPSPPDSAPLRTVEKVDAMAPPTVAPDDAGSQPEAAPPPSPGPAPFDAGTPAPPPVRVVVAQVTCGNYTVHCGSDDAGAWAINWTAADGTNQWCTNLVAPSQACPAGTACQFQGASIYQYSTCR